MTYVPTEDYDVNLEMYVDNLLEPYKYCFISMIGQFDLKRVKEELEERRRFIQYYHDKQKNYSNDFLSKAFKAHNEAMLTLCYLELELLESQNKRLYFKEKDDAQRFEDG